MRTLLAMLVVGAAAAPAAAEPVRIDGSLGFTNIQQQAKVEVGAARGERLVEHTAVTVSGTGAYQLHRHLAAVAFVDVDAGTRRAGELAGFDAQGRATIDPAVGGSFAEVWAGVGLRAQYKAAFLDVGYAAFARRWDGGRDDLPNTAGATDGAFAPILSVRWAAALGAAVRITDQLDLAVRLQWRIRYYDERGGAPLAGGVVHGTQEFRPLIGLAWHP
ncbi:MAG: hypothetical protein R3B06_02335 [Kofleriaceae bacterium]